MPSTIQFPEDLLDNTDYAGNYMLFSAKKVSGGVDTRTLKFTDATMDNVPLSVALPIPQGLNTAYQQQWDQQGVNALASAGATYGGGVMKAIDRVVSKGTVSGMAGQAMKEVSSLGSDIMNFDPGHIGGVPGRANQAGAGVIKEMTAAAMTAPLLGAVVEASQFTINKRALQQTMTSYGGPGFRAFAWQFSLKPLSAEESYNAEAIIRYFRTRSMPNQTEMEHTRVYNLPDVFKIQFFWQGSEQPFIFRVGHCACTNVAITYGGEKYTTFTGTGAPVQIDLQLSFKEMELLNRQAVINEYNVPGGTWPQNTWDKSPD